MENERQALETLVRRLHTRHGDQIQSVVLFGSRARGDAAPDSDIDVLVVLTNDDPHLCSSVRRLAARVSPEYGLTDLDVCRRPLPQGKTIPLQIPHLPGHSI